MQSNRLFLESELITVVVEKICEQLSEVRLDLHLTTLLEAFQLLLFQKLEKFEISQNISK